MLHVALFCLPLALALPCRPANWHFSLGACREGRRNIYPWAAHCTPEPLTSPRPLLNVSCDKQCPAGTHLGVQLADLQPEVECLACPAGKFSLGGGLLISGVAGDWHNAWPVGLRSSCSYQMPDGSMEQGGGSLNGLAGACDLRILAPEAVAGTYLVRRILPASKASSAPPPMARLLLAPGDRRLCQRPKLSQLGDSQEAPIYRRYWLLVAIGGCSPRQKAANAAALPGAEGILLASANALLVGSGGIAAAPATARGNTSSTTAIFKLLEDRDAQLLAAGLKTLREGLLIDNKALRGCATTSAEPRRHVDGRPGCAAWSPDELGLSIHSGDNRNYNRVVSTLELAVNIVREHGYVLFRYQVDSEVGYDGLRFEVDWSEVMPLASHQLTWDTLRVNLTRGSHFLRWQYIKDYSDSEGMDRAQLQLVQVVGTAYSDLDCFHCHGSGTHSAGGAEHCNACGRNEYLLSRSSDLAECRPCPPGRWSQAGAVGLGSCRELVQCSSRDVQVTLTPCVQGQQQQKRSWLQPIRCNVNATGAANLLTAGEVRQCTACEPYTARAAGSGACLPQQMICNASLGQFAVTELVLAKWEAWPRNMSQQVLTTFGEEQGNGSLPGGWHLRPENVSCVALDLGITGELESRLNMDVQMLLSPGTVNFTLEMSQGCQWGVHIQFLVNNLDSSQLPSMNLTRSTLPGAWTRIQASVSLWPGQHRLTWRGVHPLLSTSTEHVRLTYLRVEGAQGAGATKCTTCPPGQEVTRPRSLGMPFGLGLPVKASNHTGSSCTSCPAGFFLKQDLHRCVFCPPGRFSSSTGATQCQECPRGTVSLLAARECKVKAVLTVRDAGKEEVVVNATASLQQWDLAVHGLHGPFLVNGRQFLIDVHRPIAAEDGTAFVWEVKEECRSNRTSLPSTALLSTPPTYVPLGVHLSSVEAVAHGRVRGLRFNWVRDLEAKVGFVPCLGRPEDLQGASLLLRCDGMGGQLTARQDPKGSVHLDGLRMAGSRGSGCANLDLEWPTSMACPPCLPQDYAAQRTECNAEGYRTVTFKQMRPCLGGMRAPPGFEESCDGNGVRGIVSGVGKAVKQKYPLRAMIFSTATLLLGCVLLCYAVRLHRKYRQRFLDDGGL